jgi:uncharacterized protein DUF3602
MHSSHRAERPIFSFDEELELQRRMMQHQAPVYHIGRGGAGNFGSSSSRAAEDEDAESIGSDRRSSAGSHASSRSAGSAVGAGEGVGGARARSSLEGTWLRLKGSLGK